MAFPVRRECGLPLGSGLFARNRAVIYFWLCHRRRGVEANLITIAVSGARRRTLFSHAARV